MRISDWSSDVCSSDLYRRMAEAGAGQGLRLGVDRRLGHPWIDPDDVTCVEADGTRIVAIGKGIEPHNAYDTGVFAVTTPFFDVLERLESPSISMAVGVLAEYRRADTVDCSEDRKSTRLNSSP